MPDCLSGDSGSIPDGVAISGMKCKGVHTSLGTKGSGSSPTFPIIKK